MAYDLTYQDDCLLFTFTSTGPKGDLQKQIAFKPLADHPDVYNMGLTEVTNIVTRKTSDTVKSNNGDTWKILNTLLEAFRIFTKKYPDRAVMVVANFIDDSPENAYWRLKLYQKFIARKYNEFHHRYGRMGVPRQEFDRTGGFTKWEVVAPRTEYAAFLFDPR